MSIPVVDLFAGPGGLNEGFSRVLDSRGSPVFETVLSVEKDSRAHETLELRALYRRLRDTSSGRAAYLAYVTGKINRAALFDAAGAAAALARREAMLEELGSPTANLRVERRIAAALRARRTRDCIVIGGPPCQAYSLVGRARRARESQQEFEADPKHKLYLEYLHIVRRFEPAVFVMENVPGLLSATWRGTPTMLLICRGLSRAGYELHSLSAGSETGFKRYLVDASDHGVPQSRQRVFIVGVRRDINRRPEALRLMESAISVNDAIADLPRIRSRLSREFDSGPAWRDAVREVVGRLDDLDQDFASELKDRSVELDPDLGIGGRAIATVGRPTKNADWYRVLEVGMALNHNSRSHIRSDLWRYFFWAEYGRRHRRSPRLHDAPPSLLPAHANAAKDATAKTFVDRFRVQLSGLPATTVTSHIAKDGHYYIHPDSTQCRSLSVREAARLQTFSDDYYFEGPVTEQYKQVGNAVPPLLSHQIGKAVSAILR